MISFGGSATIMQPFWRLRVQHYICTISEVLFYRVEGGTMTDINLDYFDQFKKHLQKTILLEDDELEQVFTYFFFKHIPRKSWLLKPLQVSRVESYIVKGLFQTSVVDDSGRTTILYFPHEDWWVGDLKSFETETASQMEIYALEDAVLLQITRDNMKKLFKDHPVFERFFRILNGNMAIALQERLLQQLSANAENQYREFNLKFPRLQNRLSNKRIAGFLGITPEYFNQKLKSTNNKFVSNFILINQYVL